MSTRRAFRGRRPPRGQLLVLNRSFRRTLEAENKSPRTIQAYTDAVRLLATYCQAHRMPLLWDKEYQHTGLQRMPSNAWRSRRPRALRR
jgi:hypothetical protein